MSKLLISFCLIAISVQLIANPLEKRYSFQFTNQPLIEVIEEIETVTNLHFVFNGEIINEHKTITATFTDVPLKHIIEQLFNSADYHYMVYKNQLMLAAIPKGQKTQNKLTQKTPIQHSPKQQKQAQKQLPLKVKKIIYDTIPVYDTVKVIHTDTIVISDTITFNDTLLIYDTIIKTEAQSSDNKATSNNYIPYIGMYGGWVPSISDINETIAISDSVELKTHASIKIASGGLRAGISNKFWGIETGLSVYNFKHNYQSVLNKTFTEYKIERDTNTIIHKDSTFYFMPGMDTIWEYFDSVQYKYTEELKEYKHTLSDSSKHQNKAVYIAVPISLTISPFNTPKHHIQIGAGIVAYILAQSEGAVLIDENDEFPTLSKDFARKTFIAYYFSANYNYKICKNCAIGLEYQYQHFPESFIASYSEALRFSKFSLHIRYYLQ